MLSEDELRDALLLVFANKQVSPVSGCLLHIRSAALRVAVLWCPAGGYQAGRRPASPLVCWASVSPTRFDLTS